MNFVVSEFHTDIGDIDLPAWYWDIIPRIVSDNDNAQLITLPSFDEILDILSKPEEGKNLGQTVYPQVSSSILGCSWSIGLAVH